MNQLSFGIPLQAYDGGTLVDWWKSEGPPLLKTLSLNGTFVYDAVLDSLTGFVGKIHHTIRNIRESVDSLCRDDANTLFFFFLRDFFRLTYLKTG